MRIGLLIYGNLDILSGGYLYDRNLVLNLKKSGDHVEVISLPWRRYLSHLWDNISGELFRQLASLEIDIFLQDELNHPSLFWMNRRIRNHVAYPIVSIVHHLRCSESHPPWQNRVYRLVERLYLQSVDGFVYNSQTTRGVVEGLVAKQLPGVVAYPAGNRLDGAVSPEEISRRSMQPMPLQILFLGNVIARKGLQVLLSALKMVTDTPWLLTVVGNLEMDPLYAQEMQQQVRCDGLEAQVKFLGPLVESQLADCMRRQHLLVVPSFYEGFGIAYLEGMGFGLPAIASTAGAAHEIITEGRDGFLISPGDTSLLAKHVRSLAANRSRLADMGLAARKRFLAHPTWEESAGTVRTFLERLVTPGAALSGL